MVQEPQEQQVKKIPDNQPIVLRFRFSKTGRLRYISHLDLVRTMSKALVRAKLPIWYTQGFNPVPKMVFGTPMSVGMESECELLDLRFTEVVDPAFAMAALERATPPDIRFLEAYVPTSKLTDMRYAAYEVVLHTDIASEETTESIRRLLADPELKCENLPHGKKRERIVGGQTGDAVVAYHPEDGTIRLSLTLGVSQGEFLNPDYVMIALSAQLPIMQGSPLDCFYLIRRLAILDENRQPFR